jgi:hypothetical protein
VVEKFPVEKFRCVAATCTPSPTCRGLVPPLTSDGLPPVDIVRENIELNSIRDDLYDVVFTFAMLLPITSMFRLFAFRPLSPVNNDVVDAMRQLLV